MFTLSKPLTALALALVLAPALTACSISKQMERIGDSTEEMNGKMDQLAADTNTMSKEIPALKEELQKTNQELVDLKSTQSLTGLLSALPVSTRTGARTGSGALGGTVATDPRSQNEAKYEALEAKAAADDAADATAEQKTSATQARKDIHAGINALITDSSQELLDLLTKAISDPASLAAQMQKISDLAAGLEFSAQKAPTYSKAFGEEFKLETTSLESVSQLSSALNLVESALTTTPQKLLFGRIQHACQSLLDAGR